MQPPVVQPLDIDLFVAKSQNRIRPLQDSEVTSAGSDLSDVPPEHLLLMEADIELPPLDDEEGAYEFVTQCYHEQLGVSVSEMNALVEKTAPTPESSVPELSQWLLNGLEFMAAVEEAEDRTSEALPDIPISERAVDAAFSSI